MEFAAIVNPHYAVPIVGVIVCALLVFAFGFKSPGQPPSFDIVDEDRKAPKKRKGKENQKNKPQQNGRVPGNTSLKVDSPASGTKVKGTVEKPSSKAETRSNKKSRKEHGSKPVESGSKKERHAPEESNENSGWVQLLSKKERKNRKKDDITAVESEVIKPSVSKALDTDMDDSKENGDQNQNGVQLILTEGKAVEVSSTSLEKQIDVNTKVSSSKTQRTAKKKKGKKEDTKQSVDVTKQVPPASEALKKTAVAKETQRNVRSNKNKEMYAPLVESVTVTEPVAKELLQIQENVDAEDETKNKTKKKRGKKKNQENASDTVNMTVPPVEKGKSMSGAMTKKDIIIETKHVSQNVNGEMNENRTKEIVPSKNSSNVAFDELGDASNEKEKPQKKKKKVRREQ